MPEDSIMNEILAVATMVTRDEAVQMLKGAILKYEADPTDKNYWWISNYATLIDAVEIVSRMGLDVAIAEMEKVHKGAKFFETSQH